MPSRQDNDSQTSFLLLLLVALGLLIASGITAAHSIKFARNGQHSLGKITDCYSYGKRSGGQTCHYAFSVGQKTYSGSSDNPTYLAGNAVDVTYLADDPDTNVINPPAWFPVGLIELVFGLIAIGFSLRSFLSNADLLAD
jgi:hypothetical protein